MIHLETLAGPDEDTFQTDTENSGFEPTIGFAKSDDLKVVLTEKSSRTISDRTRRVGPRDEIITIMKKQYSYVRGKDAPRMIAMDCMEYMLTTKGGRR